MWCFKAIADPWYVWIFTKILWGARMALLALFSKEETECQRGGVWFVQGHMSSDREESQLWSGPLAWWEQVRGKAQMGKEEWTWEHGIPYFCTHKLPLVINLKTVKTLWRSHLHCFCFASRRWSLLGEKGRKLVCLMPGLRKRTLVWTLLKSSLSIPNALKTAAVIPFLKCIS